MFVLFSFNTIYAYGQSKLANILDANELAKRLKVINIFATQLSKELLLIFLLLQIILV